MYLHKYTELLGFPRSEFFIVKGLKVTIRSPQEYMTQSEPCSEAHLETQLSFYIIPKSPLTTTGPVSQLF